MANNKVQLADGSVLIDLTSDTVIAAALRSGYTAHDAAGNVVNGALEVDPVYSITKTLTNVSSSNDDTKVIAGGSFCADLTPTSGYAITSITVTMGGVDVTDQVFKPGVGGKGITANGVYSASDDALSGYDRVVVNVAPNLGTKSITANGTYTASSDSLDGFSSVTVNVPTGGGTPELQSKTATYTPSTSTQTETIIADTGYDGLSSVGVTVNPIPSEYVIPSGTKSITENGTGIDVSAYASVDVAVPTGGGEGSSDFSIETGTFTIASAFRVSASGTKVNVGFSGHPDYIYIWLSRESFEAIASPEGGRFYRIVLVKNDPDILATIPPIRYSASVDVQSFYPSTVPYIRAVSVTPYDSSDASNTTGKAVSALAYYNRNNTYNSINDDGTITIARYSTATPQFYAGTYYYVAVTGAGAFWMPS